MANKKIYSRGYRIRKAYWTAFVVMISYVKLSLLGKVFGNHYYQERIGAVHFKNANRVKITILKLDSELKEYLDAPANTPALRQ